ncbi:hypothetical protein HMPREF9071_1386 [Capnocytophaga sp. oral taxon 338 str. F0234]|nr:hypothetical protein HMPREF9071_1386 [Capnocytophaga sp. oral taxon 338 str. F0234]
MLVCIQQKDESILYDILSNIFKDDLLGYYLEDYNVYLYQLFLYKPSFFIKNTYKYGDSSIVEYINNSLPNTFYTKGNPKCCLLTSQKRKNFKCFNPYRWKLRHCCRLKNILSFQK